MKILRSPVCRQAPKVIADQYTGLEIEHHKAIRIRVTSDTHHYSLELSIDELDRLAAGIRKSGINF